MKTTITASQAAAATGSYSPALRVGPWIFVSGQGPISPEGQIIPGDITAQTKLTLDNIRTLVEAAGGTMAQVVKCSCYLADIGDFDAFDAVYRSYFSAPLPARTTVQAGLADILVEIDATIYLGEV